ncbi:MAG TPA: flagellar biosynthetic protein FliO [Spirochaetota bacterium]|nr:flagellar biosynthetic protein FliO [Spirochaetota bacterium]HPS86994.1 flagellar biosynthetic protein FliO [Spirochaetota bacterium]
MQFFIFSVLFILSVLTSMPLNAQNSTPDAQTVTNTNGNNAAVNNNAVPGQGFVEEDFKPQVEEESAAWMIIKTILVLGLFVGGFYMFFKFVTQKAGLHVSGQEAIQILSTVSLGTNKFVQIVDVAGKVFLLGVSDSSINLLTEIKDREDIDRIRLLSSRSTPVQGATFPEFIAAQVGWVIEKINEKRTHGFKKTTVEEISPKEFDMSYLNKQKNRLKNINGNDDE